jgi:tyrosine-protein kinase
VELRQYARLILRYWLLLLVAMAVGGAAGVLLTVTQPDQYQTSTILGVVGTTDAVGNKERPGLGQAYQSQLLGQSAVATYAALASSQVVLQDAAASMGHGVDAGTLARELTVQVPTGTSLVELTVQDATPGRAQQIATEIGSSLTTQAAKAAPTNAGVPAPTLVVVQPAALPTRPVDAGLTMNALLGAMLGLLIGLGLASLHLYLRGNLHGRDDVHRMLPAPVLASVRLPRKASAPFFDRGELRDLALLVLEQRAQRDGPVVLTGATDAADTSQLSARLAEVIAASRTRVLLVSDGLHDVGWKGSTLSGSLATGPRRGSRTRRGDSVRLDPTGPAQDECLSGLRSGLSDAGAPLLSGTRLHAAVESAAQSFDLVILDAPALSRSIHGAVIGSPGSTNLLVVGARGTRRRDLDRAFRAMAATSCDLHGIVLTRRGWRR